MRKLAKKMRITIDAKWRVFSPDAQSLRTPAHAVKAVPTLNQRRMLAERLANQDRSDWVENVEACWLDLQASAHLWIKNAEEQLNKIARQIGGSANVYLVDSQVPVETRNKARQILEVANAVRVAKRDGSIDWWVFAPFKWPKVDIERLVESVCGKISPSSRGLLDAIGYHVGQSGLLRNERRKVLRDAMLTPSLPVSDYMPPLSCRRLERIAYTIAFEANTHKRIKDRDYSQAVADWVEDLEWLKVNFYLGKCDGGGFPWPEIH